MDLLLVFAAALLGLLVGYAWAARKPPVWRGLRRRPGDIPAVWRSVAPGMGFLILPSLLDPEKRAEIENCLGSQTSGQPEPQEKP